MQKSEFVLKKKGSNQQVLRSSIIKLGEVGAKIREQILETTSVLTSPYFQPLRWIKDKIDPSDLARKRWVGGKTLDQIAVESGHGRTAVVKQFKLMRLNPELIKDRRLRKLIE